MYAQDTSRQKLIGSSLFDSTRPKPVAAPLRPAPPEFLAKTKDSIPVPVVKRRVHDPNKATIRSAIFPGLGQIYNREYWKLPLVYGALAIPTATFFFNNSYYKKAKFAYEAVYLAGILQPDGTYDSTKYFAIDPSVLGSNGKPLTASTYQSARNAYRQARDYSVLWFLIIWGINVVDATVFGHLKTFDVSDDLSLNVSPTFNTMTRTPGIGLVLSYKKPTPRYSLSALR